MIHFLDIFLQDKRLASAAQEIGLNRRALCLYASNTARWWGNESCRTGMEPGTESLSSVLWLETIYYKLITPHLLNVVQLVIQHCEGEVLSSTKRQWRFLLHPCGTASNTRSPNSSSLSRGYWYETKVTPGTGSQI